MEVFLVILWAVSAFGAQPRGIDWRIIGGTPADEGAYPYQVSIKYYGQHICGGSIIDSTTILTAAHCVYQFTTSIGITVLAGTTQLNYSGVEYEVTDFSAHTGYESLFKHDDIAILKLGRPISYTDKIQPIDLETEYVEGNMDCIMTGWGYLSFPGSTTNDLHQLELKTLTTEECREDLFNDTINENQICTFTRQGEGTCVGDSGGPLAANNKQIGIVSWGFPCATGYPDVFTRVSAYAEWIEEHRH